MPDEAPPKTTPDSDEFRVAATTDPHQLAKLLLMRVSEGKKPKLITIGPGPLNQAMKAVVRLNQLAASRAGIYSVLPSMEDRQVPNTKDGSGFYACTVTILTLVKYVF